MNFVSILLICGFIAFAIVQILKIIKICSERKKAKSEKKDGVVE